MCIGMLDPAIILGQKTDEAQNGNQWAGGYAQEIGEPELSGPEGVIRMTRLIRSCAAFEGVVVVRERCS